MSRQTALVAALAGLLLIVPRWIAESPPLYDFVEYWAAGQLLVAGENPYDPVRVHELELQAGRTDEPILMWNPPWALPLVLPLGTLPARPAHILWMALNLLALVASAQLLWRNYGGDAARPWIAALLTVTFAPALIALVVGQISPLVLLGAAAFLPLVRNRRDFAAGAVTTLLAVKPHMAYLFWAALVVWAVGAGRWRLLVGGTVAGVVLTGIAMAFRPTVVADYWHTLRETPSQYASPTIGCLLRLALDSPSFGWQFVPLVPGFGWLAWWGWRHRANWDWSEQLPTLLLASALTAAYGAWLFDLVLLLVPVIALAARLSQPAPSSVRMSALAVYAGVGVAVMVMLKAEVPYLAFIWVTPALLVTLVVIRRSLVAPAIA